MILSIEIPDKNLQEFANTFSLVNDGNLQNEGEKTISKYVSDQMRTKIEHDEQISIKAIVDSKLAEGEVKPAAK